MKFPFDLAFTSDLTLNKPVEMKIQPEDWAPGIWAGTEGGNISIDAQIVAIDFEKRVLVLKLREPVIFT